MPVGNPHTVTCVSFDSIPKAFIPIDNRCHECDKKLKDPLLLLKNAHLCEYYTTGVLHVRLTFIKICPACPMCCRYQEFTDRVHNFDNKFLISLFAYRRMLRTTLLFLTVCDMLEQYSHIKFKQQTVFTAFVALNRVTI